MSARRSFLRRSAAVGGSLLAAALVLLRATSSAADEFSNALVPRTVEVPSSLRTAPFDQDRVLMVPPGCKISVIARLPGARFVMPLLTGAFLVAVPWDQSIVLVRPQAD